MPNQTCKYALKPCSHCSVKRRKLGRFGYFKTELFITCHVLKCLTMSIARNPYWTGRIITVDLLLNLVLNSWFSHWNYIFCLYKTTYLNEDVVNCAEPSPTVRISCLKVSNFDKHTSFELKSRTELIRLKRVFFVPSSPWCVWGEVIIKLLTTSLERGGHTNYKRLTRKVMINIVVTHYHPKMIVRKFAKSLW